MVLKLCLVFNNCFWIEGFSFKSYGSGGTSEGTILTLLGLIGLGLIFKLFRTRHRPRSSKRTRFSWNLSKWVCLDHWRIHETNVLACFSVHVAAAAALCRAQCTWWWAGTAASRLQEARYVWKVSFAGFRRANVFEFRRLHQRSRADVVCIRLVVNV